MVFKDNVWTKASKDTAQDFAGLFDDAGEGQGNDDPAQAVMDRMVRPEVAKQNETVLGRYYGVKLAVDVPASTAAAEICS
jgi:hypothetical protein